jgi:lactate permease
VLFAILQMETAGMLGLHVPLILGAQTAGASLGSVMAPAKVIVGCSTVGLGGKEGAVMLRVMKWGVIPLALVALAATILVR